MRRHESTCTTLCSCMWDNVYGVMLFYGNIMCNWLKGTLPIIVFGWTITSFVDILVKVFHLLI